MRSLRELGWDHVGFVAQERDFGFYSNRQEANGGFWAEVHHDLTYILIGSAWNLGEGWTVVGREWKWEDQLGGLCHQFRCGKMVLEFDSDCGGGRKYWIWIHFEEELTGLLSTLGAQFIFVESMDTQSILGWGRTFPWSGWNIPVIPTPPDPTPTPLLFPCSFAAVWWLTLCSTSPHYREECSWTLNTRTLSLENIHNSSKFGFWIICSSHTNFP